MDSRRKLRGRESGRLPIRPRSHDVNCEGEGDGERMTGSGMGREGKEREGMDTIEIRGGKKDVLGPTVGEGVSYTGGAEVATRMMDGWWCVLSGQGREGEKRKEEGRENVGEERPSRRQFSGHEESDAGCRRLQYDTVSVYLSTSTSTADDGRARESKSQRGRRRGAG